ncbi:hypothetical protein [Photobacterium sp. 1_MG-2023]|uniref:hypothetical protein n=1 Tax=Photobacterium sp. 1_MG-2023 TaxID=3062646 RepID=UPI0026E13E96|nr:hypothetical protein [Photobacterium sp. 1_MG-2023]MDO6708123.1 hypothetical protein [Photobacterium sp. 1_MG-2023]
MRQAGIHQTDPHQQRQTDSQQPRKVSSTRMFQIALGVVLLLLGAYVLVLLGLNLYDYIQSFPGTPVHQYIVDIQDYGFFLAFGDSEFRVSRSFLNILALFFGLHILKIWLSIGKTLVQTGKFLLDNKTDQK